MPPLPVDMTYTPEETTVLGDIDAFIAYVESGQALTDWDARISSQTAECDAFLREHGHVWGHIIIQGAPRARTLQHAA